MIEVSLEPRDILLLCDMIQERMRLVLPGESYHTTLEELQDKLLDSLEGKVT